MAGTEQYHSFKTISYVVRSRVAYITLNRPARLNAICRPMPTELARAVEIANRDDDVRVIVLNGAGRAFCAGYDLHMYAESLPPAELASKSGSLVSWDPAQDYAAMKTFTEKFMSLWHSRKPTICKIQGYAIAGGSDIALCCDLIVMADDAKIGYPPARVWGCPTTAMWTFRIGEQMAKRLLFTGDLITGKEAARIGLVCESVPAEKLDETVEALAQRIATVPSNQLLFQKLVINQVVESQGLASAQTLATLLDGITRHTPEGFAFQQRCADVGFKTAVKERDSGVPLDISRFQTKSKL
eukprot:208079_1